MVELGFKASPLGSTSKPSCLRKRPVCSEHVSVGVDVAQSFYRVTCRVQRGVEKPSAETQV